jgi:hypothetical protein
LNNQTGIPEELLQSTNPVSLTRPMYSISDQQNRGMIRRPTCTQDNQCHHSHAASPAVENFNSFTNSHALNYEAFGCEQRNLRESSHGDSLGIEAGMRGLETLLLQYL